MPICHLTTTLTPWVCYYPQDMGALSELILEGILTGTCQQAGRMLLRSPPPTLELGMNDVDFSNKNLGVGKAVIISAWMDVPQG
jgi:hypothetical protein